MHGYSSAHSIPWPVACSWKDGDPHCSIRTYRGKRAVGEKKKGTSATAGRPPCGRKDSAQDRARLERERRRAFYSLFKAPRRSASEPVTRANRPAKADGGSKGEQESLPPKRPLLPRSLFASCCFLASCGEALLAPFFSADLLSLFSFLSLLDVASPH